METRTINGVTISRIGIGGHYKAMEEGGYEDRYAYVEREVAARVPIIEKAIASGITFFDTTWRNEVAMLSAVLEQLGARERVAVNGMVLGAFTGSKANGQTVEDYFNQWLDARLEVIPGRRFDTFMINAIEEGYDAALCERLLALMQKRRAAGDFKVIGFSCHSPEHARQVADRFPEFELVMVPYNFRNRRFETAFDGYTGSAAFIAMKPLVWTEYGIPFCAINAHADFEQRFGFTPAADAATRAIRFLRSSPRITAIFNAINSLAELDLLVAAGEGAFTEADSLVLDRYNQAITSADGMHLYLAGLKQDNLRMNYFGALHLSRLLGVPMPAIALNEPDAPQRIHAHAEQLYALVADAERSPRPGA
jgi:predicted aldo/keto reductase-like oxidoreductase